ncbi:MAG TPA: hypothetical protein VFZ22_21225 [Pyrinomonadaceae bacterium]|nr:hypothetical protein [Pyrinomonadaceae bacterium]
MFRRLLVLFFVVTLAATPAVSFQKKINKPAKEKTDEVEAEAEQQRIVAVALVTTLAEEARSFKDLTRRARVQARAADVLWDTDPERARELFRRAWEAAENVDNENARQRSEEIKRMEGGGGPVVLRGGPDLRSEVLRLVSKRDRKLGEEFLKALDEANAKANEEASAAARRSGGPMDQLGASKRLQLARRLVDDGEIDRAMEFAAPALNAVNLDSIFFLSALREKNAQLADNAFNTLLGYVTRDPLSDANTVSGLSSYVLTPFLYVTFEPSGGANQNRSRPPQPAPDVNAAVRGSFLKAAFQILMQPSPAPDQDRTTSGVRGKYMVIKRLLPIFEQYAPDLASSLRTQMTALASYVPPDLQGENRAVTVGITPDEDQSDPYQRMQERLDRAKSSNDRDAIYADYAVALTGKGDPRARDLVDKIENSELRKNVRAYTDFQLVQLAVRKKDAAEAARLAKNGELTSIQRVWAYTSAAKLLIASERSRALDLLNEALAEARRISNSDPDRARALTAVAANLAELDLVRAWETLSEVVKAANAADAFTGEDSRISSRLETPMMVVMSNSTAEDFDLLAVFSHLARADLLRAVQLAKTFTGEAPRAVATLAISRSILEKRKQG